MKSDFNPINTSAVWGGGEPDLDNLGDNSGFDPPVISLTARV